MSYKSASAGNDCARRPGSSQDDATETSISNLLDDLEAVFERHGAVRLLPQCHFHGGHVAVWLDLTKTGSSLGNGAIKKLQSKLQARRREMGEGRSRIKRNKFDR